jgi:hypothetical protein
MTKFRLGWKSIFVSVLSCNITILHIIAVDIFIDLDISLTLSRNRGCVLVKTRLDPRKWTLIYNGDVKGARAG